MLPRPCRPVLLALLAAASCAREPGDSPPAGAVCAAPAPRPSGLLAAGSGANLALVRAIAARYEAANPGERVVVPESIGSSGAIKAVRAGAIDLGLISRPLSDAERALGLVEIPLARVAFAPTVRAEVPLRGLSRDELAALFSGRPPPGWPEGLPLAPQLREARDTGSTIVVERLPQVGQAIEEARRGDRWLTRYSDQELRDSLLVVDGAVGFLDAASARLERLPLRSLAIDGVEPTAEQVRAGRFPVVRRLGFVSLGAPAGAAARFVAFARSEAVADLFALGELVREGAGEGERGSLVQGQGGGEEGR